MALEIFAVIFALLYLFLAMKQHIACWYAAFISTLIYILIYWDVSLYMESLLNFYYLLMAIYGWINWNKKDFIGKKQAYSEKNGKGPEQKIVTLEVNATDADASGFEPIWIKEKRVGFVTSGGYGHRVKKSLAMALVDSEYVSDGQEVKVHVVGKEQAAIVIPSSPYDPSGILMRS